LAKKINKKIGRKYNQKKIRASQKICKKKIAILIFPPFEISRNKNSETKVVFLVKKYYTKIN
jgi:hypothetical protein